MSRLVPNVRSGDAITEVWANALAGAVNEASRQLESISAAQPLTVSRDAAGIRIALASELQIEPYELAADLSQGGSADAHLVRYDGSDWIADEERTIQVHDALGTFNGSSGDRGFALFHRGSGHWVVLQLEC